MRATIVLCALTLELSSAEFAKMHRLDSDDLQARFGLPIGCQPVMAAVRPSPRGKLVVLITCADDPGEPTQGNEDRPVPAK